MDDERESPPSEDPSVRALRAELDEGLAADRGVLVHPAFLGVLHRELRERLGAGDGTAVLLRAGFFHGLRDALRTLRLRTQADGRPGTSPFAPLVAMRMRDASSDAEDRGVRGHWPEAVEARALAGVTPAPGGPGCVLSAGYTSGWLSGLWEADVLALEQACSAAGAASCRFVARSAEVWRASGDEQATQLLEKLPFEALWTLADAAAEAPEDAPPGTVIDRDSPAVHVWGPVMVLPYGGLETAAAVEAIAHEPAGREVSVVVIDLAGAILDEGFGAASLERTLDAIEAWGAEAILTGVSPLSEAVLADLDRTHLVLRKDLPEAVAAAFQIAEAQRCPT